MAFTREVNFTAAYDRRNPDPKKDYGVHGVEIRFVLRGDAGAVQFVLSTQWQLPHVTAEGRGRPYAAVGGDPHWMERPMPRDLGYHSPVPRYDGQTSVGPCPYVGNQPCYYDGSSLDAEPVFHRLLAEGDAGVWDALEQYYRHVFEEGHVGGFGQVLKALATAVHSSTPKE